MNRAEWEATRGYNEPFPPWRLATPAERAQMFCCYAIAASIGAVAAIAILIAIGVTVDNIADRRGETQHCLRMAVNALEAEACRR